MAKSKQVRRTKMLCTVGPASAALPVLTAMMNSGMDMARLNFSHATHADHARLIRTIRHAARSAKKMVPIIGDLQGPKIRLGVLPDKGMALRNGKTVTLPVTYVNLYRDLKKGDRIYMDDGIIETTFVRGSRGKIEVKVVSGGVVTSHKGMNFPDSTLKVPAFTSKDKEDVLFGIEQGVDWFALSFVTKASQVLALKRFVKQKTHKGKPLARVIVKIEKHEAIDAIDAIIKAADGIIVARGDLGVEIDAEEVPIRQKEMIQACRHAGKPVVIATQMLDSMIRNPRPTRAEVSDVANAVFDCASGVMLSGESASGKYPLQAVKMMAKIIKQAEASCYDDACEMRTIEF
ncbi:pyruvate kinase [Candidatus Uhrbacteria bacterium]|nr:pyruvate kinase [Candidatus Uhrbacteria bacterium]